LLSIVTSATNAETQNRMNPAITMTLRRCTQPWEISTLVNRHQDNKGYVRSSATNLVHSTSKNVQ